MALAMLGLSDGSGLSDAASEWRKTVIDDLQKQLEGLRRDLRGLFVLCLVLAVCLIIVAVAR